MAHLWSAPWVCNAVPYLPTSFVNAACAFLSAGVGPREQMLSVCSQQAALHFVSRF